MRPNGRGIFTPTGRPSSRGIARCRGPRACGGERFEIYYAGVTTVCHHNPRHPRTNESRLSHSRRSKFALGALALYGAQLSSKFRESHADLPFILHAAEGIDARSAQRDLRTGSHPGSRPPHRAGPRARVHSESVSLINRRAARRSSSVLRPTISLHRSPSLAFIQSLDTVVLGSDSPLTAAGDFLDEINFARNAIGLDTNSLYAMVTTRSAEVLRLRNGEKAPQAWLASRICWWSAIPRLRPAETLAGLTLDRIEMVIVGGRIQLADPSIYRAPSRRVQARTPALFMWMATRDGSGSHR